jgi:hypothetical protein
MPPFFQGVTHFGVFYLGSKSLNKTWVSELLWMLGGDDGDINTAGVWILLGLGIDHCCDRE